MQELSVTNNSRRLEFIVWGALILTVLAIAGAFIYKRLGPQPVSLPIIAAVGDFTLTNQHGKEIARGKTGMLCFNYETRKLASLPEKAAEKLQDGRQIS